MISRTNLTKAATAIGSTLTLMGTRVAFASASPIAVPSSVVNGAAAAQPLGTSTDLTPIFKVVTDILLYIIGAIAVIVMVIGGLQYVLSSGDSKKVATAKDTILYAIIGVVVAILAYAIINFVFGRLTTTS